MNKNTNRGRRGSSSRNANKSTFKSRGDKNKRKSFGKFSKNRGRSSHTRNSQRGGRGGRRMTTFNPSQFINSNPVDIKEEIYTPKNTFGTFGLNSKIESVVEKMGIKEPTPIQDQIIPEIMKGNDVIGLAETGTGKTAAFLLPIIHKTIDQKNRQTLILAPTRELAIQIQDELNKFSSGFYISSVVCVGGINIRPQIRTLKQRRNNFIIGTPGRVLDLINSKHLETKDITTLVLDEADRMLDMGFIHDMRKIVGTLPKERETLFFSATTSKETDAIIHDFLRNPVTVSVKKRDVTSSIEQGVIYFKKDTKFETLLQKFKEDNLDRVIIFCAMKHAAQKLSEMLTKSGIKSDAIHGNKSHVQRQRALKSFKDGSVKVLVATDVAARGIHVDNVSHIINYDLPSTFEDYVHRIGRTGRGNKKGKAYTFIEGRDR